MSIITANTNTPVLGRLRLALILAVVLVADILDLLDSTITNIAAPTIADDLGGGQQLIQWAGASYALALGVLLVLGGRLGDKYGRRRLFLVGLIGFTVASAACGLAISPEMFIASRVLQGAFGASIGRMEGLLRGGELERRGRGGPLKGAARAAHPVG